MANGHCAHEFCKNSVDRCFLALTLFWERMWYFTFDQKLVINGRRTGRFPLIRGRKFSFSRCVIVWCRLLLSRLILTEYENIQFYLPVNTFHLHFRVQPVKVYCENHTEHNPYSMGKMQRFLMLKHSSISAQSISSTYIVISLPCV